MTIHSIGSKAAVKSAEARVAGYDWQELAEELSGYGCAVMEKLLTPEECRQIAALYPQEEHFRSHADMARHGFGKGEYRYFRYPLLEIANVPSSRFGRCWLHRSCPDLDVNDQQLFQP